MTSSTDFGLFSKALYLDDATQNILDILTHDLDSVQSVSNVFLPPKPGLLPVRVDFESLSYFGPVFSVSQVRTIEGEIFTEQKVKFIKNSEKFFPAEYHRGIEPVETIVAIHFVSNFSLSIHRVTQQQITEYSFFLLNNIAIEHGF